MALVGAEVKRKEDPRLITGTSAYVADIGVPGLHYVAFVRSPHAHARIRSINTTGAARLPGLRMVRSGRDLRGHCAPLPVGGSSSEGGGSANPDNVGRGHYPLSTNLVRHVGEAVAA